MPLYLYKHKPVTVLIKPEWVDWVNQYANDLINEDPEAERRVREVKAYKLSTIAFAARYNLMDQWEKKQQKVSKWPAWVDFTVGAETIRIVSVSGNEENQLGYKTNGRVWQKEYDAERHTIFILSVWWTPYVDFLGWMPRAQLMMFPCPGGYNLQEPALQPMSSIPTKKLSDM